MDTSSLQQSCKLSRESRMVVSSADENCLRFTFAGKSSPDPTCLHGIDDFDRLLDTSVLRENTYVYIRIEIFPIPAAVRALTCSAKERERDNW